MVENNENNYDNIYNRNQIWKSNITKKNNYINKINETNEQKYSFAPNINKNKNIKTIFKENEYSDYWLKHNKYYIHRRLKFINNDNRNINPINSYLLRLKGKKGNIPKTERNKNNSTLDFIENKTDTKININYIKQLLHEELQNTKSDEEDEINQEIY